MAYRPSEGRNQKNQSPPVQPDLVPIMNLFMALIPFLLMMIVISQIALVALNFSASGGGGGGGEGGGGETAKELKVIIMASEGNQIFPGFEIREPDSGAVTIKNSANGKFNFMALNNALGNLKTRNQQIGDITIVVYPDVLYGTLIQTIDLCKQNGFPNVIYKPATVSYGSGG